MNLISTSITDGIATLTIDMPGRSMNVLSLDLVDELDRVFTELLRAPEVTGIIVASGKSSFVAGADLAWVAGLARPGTPREKVMAEIGALGTLLRRIETSGKPVVAAASGTALGGGLELMLGCHYRIAAQVPGAQFGLPEVKLGVLPGAGGTQRMPRLIGIAASLPLITQGTHLSAEEAHRLGLLDELTSPENLLAAADRALREGRVKAIAAWDEKGYVLPGGDAYTPANRQALIEANASLHASKRGLYPATLAILRCIYEGARLPMDKALQLELKHFATLVPGPVADNLIRINFFAKQAAAKLARRPVGIPRSKVAELGVIGVGLMGAGIAQVAALAGIEVVMLDRDLVLAERAREQVAVALDKDVAKGRLTAVAREQALARIRPVSGYAALGNCDLVVEAIVEDADIKAVVTRAACEAMKPGAIFASNTSALPIGELAQASPCPEHFIGLHFFSPVPRMGMVEVIVGPRTSDQTLARAMDFISQLRKSPFVVNDGYGFYTSRCFDAYVREGMRLLVDGVAPALVENAALAIGMNIGPLALADEVGLDVIQHTSRFYRSREPGPIGDDRHKVNALVDRQNQFNRLGRKSGAGFYLYPQGAAKHIDQAHCAQFASQRLAMESAVASERLLYAQLLEAARCWAEGVIVDTTEADLGAQNAWSFPAWLGGPFSAIEQIGPDKFVARCDVLCAQLGARFTVPRALRELAASGAMFHRD
ncbi:3-hydroxyacyl-CoA dehydrogenase NAD-binding domain-containing protein [Pseudomonas sp. NPDC090755]|uniref:3-hydroxyacyl-CoA dehydrogenase NAD-binding domain-containing protein n=1 Tax=Pseudomonas sp. NPDC090755 TaxID=3364481 RepID=UPI00383BC310